VIESLLRDVRAWASSESLVEAVALVGSHARGDARPDSDVDLVLLSSEPEALLREREWLTRFGVVESVVSEDWGRVTSLRVFYANGVEVEFGVAGPDWAADPDEGTRRVVEDGFAVVWDPRGLLAPLRA
jgi:predicted nucleotidyltransferase